MRVARSRRPSNGPRCGRAYRAEWHMRFPSRTTPLPQIPFGPPGPAAFAVRHDRRDARRLAEKVGRAGDDVAGRGDNKSGRGALAGGLVSAAVGSGRESAEAFDTNQRRLDLGCRGAKGLGSEEDSGAWRWSVLTRGRCSGHRDTSGGRQHDAEYRVLVTQY